MLLHSDVYSFGVVLWELLHSARPFEEELFGLNVTPWHVINHAMINHKNEEMSRAATWSLNQTHRVGLAWQEHSTSRISIAPQSALHWPTQVSPAIQMLHMTELNGQQARPAIHDLSQWFDTPPAEWAALCGLVERCWAQEPHDRPSFNTIQP